MIVCGALVVAPTSTVFTPQELAHKMVALDYGNGTAYAGILMLEGAMPREAVTTRAATLNSGDRLAALLRGEFEATVLQEPWITLAEKAGCRLVSTTFFHGTWVADPSVSPEAYAAFVRAVTAAVRRINADKRRYVSYFIRDFPDHQASRRSRRPTSTWAASSSRSRAPSPSTRRAGHGNGWRAGA